MKYAVFLIAIFFSFQAVADLRGETFGNYAHFVLDKNNADNELYMPGANCEDISIEVADGVANGTAKCWLRDVAEIPWAKYEQVLPGASIAVIGFAGQPCALVTSNYDAATNTQNQTEYTTTETGASYRAEKQPNGNYDISFEFECSNATR